MPAVPSLPAVPAIPAVPAVPAIPAAPSVPAIPAVPSGGRPPADPAAAPPPPADPETVARTICLRLLSRRAYTRSELATALQRRRVPGEAAEVALDRLERVGLIDDAAFAAAWVSSRHAGRGLARRALADELRGRGVAPDTASAALAGLDREDEEETARRLVGRRLPALRGVPDEVRRRRLTGLLARKGYPPALSRRVVDGVLGDHAGAGAEAPP